MFNAENFLNTTINGSSSTQAIQAPEGEFIGIIAGVAAKQGRNSEDEVWTAMMVTVDFEDEAVTSVTNRNPTRITYPVFLDITPEGNIDMSEGANIGLGRLREAVGQNDPEAEWTPGNLQGNTAIFRIEHKANPRDGETYAKITRVAPVE